MVDALINLGASANLIKSLGGKIMFGHIIKFVGLIALMYLMSVFTFGNYLNSAIVLIGLWKLVD